MSDKYCDYCGRENKHAAQLESEKEQLLVEIAKYHCPIRLEDSEINGVSICSAGYCYKCLQRQLAAKQAEIDDLMLEYCPNEMTPEQIK